MVDNQFLDFYEILQISPNASADTVDRVFRHLAQRYHPDNQKTGDSYQFHKVIEAHDTLKNAEKRAQYDLIHQQVRESQWGLAKEVIGEDGFDSDEKVQERILSLLYVKCRQNVHNPGIGNLELENLLNCTHGQLEFHYWYLKEKGFIYRTDSGLLALTVTGVDQFNANRKSHKHTKPLIADKSNEAIKL